MNKKYDITLSSLLLSNHHLTPTPLSEYAKACNPNIQARIQRHFKNSNIWECARRLTNCDIHWNLLYIRPEAVLNRLLLSTGTSDNQSVEWLDDKSPVTLSPRGARLLIELSNSKCKAHKKSNRLYIRRCLVIASTEVFNPATKLCRNHWKYWSEKLPSRLLTRSIDITGLTKVDKIRTRDSSNPKKNSLRFDIKRQLILPGPITRNVFDPPAQTTRAIWRTQQPILWLKKRCIKELMVSYLTIRILANIDSFKNKRKPESGLHLQWCRLGAQHRLLSLAAHACSEQYQNSIITQVMQDVICLRFKLKTPYHWEVEVGSNVGKSMLSEFMTQVLPWFWVSIEKGKFSFSLTLWSFHHAFLSDFCILQQFSALYNVAISPTTLYSLNEVQYICQQPHLPNTVSFNRICQIRSVLSNEYAEFNPYKFCNMQ